MSVNLRKPGFAQGDTVIVSFNVYSAGTTPATLIAPTALYTIARNAYSTDVLLAKSGVMTNNAGLWTMTVQLTYDDTISLPADSATLYQQASIRDSDGSNELIYGGPLTVTPAIPESVILAKLGVTPPPTTIPPESLFVATIFGLD